MRSLTYGVKIQIRRTSILKKRRQNACRDWFHIDGLSDHEIRLAERDWGHFQTSGDGIVLFGKVQQKVWQPTSLSPEFYCHNTVPAAPGQ